MGKDGIDASVGLAFSLALFERYRKSGLLQAELHHVPGIRGRCKGSLHLVEGKVMSCYAEDKQGQRLPVSVSKEMFSRLDRERGPFEWTLQPVSTPPPPPPPSPQRADPSPRPMQGSPVPTRIAQFNREKLDGWTTRQKMVLAIIFGVIDGRHTIEEIKADVPLPPGVVEEALRVLLSMKVISIPC